MLGAARQTLAIALWTKASILWRIFMAALAMSICPAAIPFSMACSAYRLDVVMVFGGVSEIMIVLMAPLPIFPNMLAVGACQRIRMRPAPGPNLNINALARLFFVAVAWRVRRGTWVPCSRINAERHSRDNTRMLTGCNCLLLTSR